jgi:hypothetical protein
LASKVDLKSSGLITVARLRQQVTIKNTKATPIDGPLYVELSGLTPGVILQNQVKGVQNAVSLNGDPLVEIKALGESLAPNETKNITLEFDNQTPQVLSYDPKIVDSAGQQREGSATTGGLVIVSLSRQQVTINNTSGIVLTGPFYLSINGLTPGATLNNSTAKNPSNSAPMIGLPIESLAVGAKTTVLLEFLNPTPNALNFTPDLVQGVLAKPQIKVLKKIQKIKQIKNVKKIKEQR